MKNVLTIALTGDGKFDESQLFGGTEVVALEGDTPLAGLKKAKGKYTVLVADEAKVDELADFLTAADSANADVLAFPDGYAFKTGLIMKVPAKEYLPYSAEIAAILSAKSVQKLNKRPLHIAKTPADTSEAATAALIRTIADYTACKGKAPLEVYALARDLICSKLTEYYLTAMLEIFKKPKEFQRLVDFDGQISNNDKVLYLVFDNRFSQLMNLKKLRAKKFKINLFEYIKIKNLLKK